MGADSMYVFVLPSTNCIYLHNPVRDKDCFHTTFLHSVPWHNTLHRGNDWCLLTKELMPCFWLGFVLLIRPYQAGLLRVPMGFTGLWMCLGPSHLALFSLTVPPPPASSGSIFPRQSSTQSPGLLIFSPLKELKGQWAYFIQFRI